MPPLFIWIARIIPCYFFLTTAIAGELSGFDLVTMKNGDIHHGTLVRQAFVIKTDYGSVSVPSVHIKQLILGQGDLPDRLLTHYAEQVSGEMHGENVQIVRDQSPTLPLHVADISHIEFGDRPLKTKPGPIQQGMVLQNGDRLWGQVENLEVLLINPVILLPSNTVALSFVSLGSIS